MTKIGLTGLGSFREPSTKMDSRAMTLGRAQGLFVSIVTTMVVVLITKMASVWFYGSRSIQRPWPYDGFLFQLKDRFTDYLVPYLVAGYHNIYDPADWTAAGLVPPPYGYFQYALLRYLPFRSSLVVTYGSFLVVLGAFVAILWFTYIRNYGFVRPHRLLYFMVFVVACLPIAFEIDRGNLDLFGALIVAGLYALTQRRGVMSGPTAILIAMLMSLKPSFAVFAIPLVLCIRWFWTLIAGALVAFNYAVPVIFYGAKPNYLINLIKSASAVTNGVSLYSHNLAGGLLAMGIHTGTAFDIAVGLCLLAIVVWVRYQIRDLDKRHAFLTILTLAVLVTLIANSPSNDYRLILLLPAFMALPTLLPNLIGSTEGRALIVISFVLAFGYTNIPFPGVFDYFTTLRALSLIVIFGLFVWEARIARSTVNVMPSMNIQEGPEP